MQSAPIELSCVRRLFSRPDRLAVADFIYREIANRMLERLDLVRLDPAQVLDAGCGSGADVNLLQHKFPKAQVIGVDGSFAYLQQAVQQQRAASVSVNRLLAAWLKRRSAVANHQWICADFAELPLSAQSVDVVWSNLALHWHPQPDQVFAGWRRLLKVDGLLMFSCFGPDSLKEIRQAFDEVDLTPHTLPFVDMHDFGDMLVNAGFATPVMDMEIITLTYSTVPQLLAEVRALGGLPLDNRRSGLMGKMSWRKMCDRLESMRQADGKIPLTLEVIYGHAFKPVSKRTAAGESIIKFDFPKK